MSRLGPDFDRLFVASAASNVADGVVRLAFPLLAASLTRDPVVVSGVTSLVFLPWLLFALPSGAFVDRTDRRRAMAGANLGRTAALAVLGVTVALGHASMPVVYVGVFALGLAETVYDSAARAVLPSVVEREALDPANARLHAAEMVGQEFLGAPLAGALFAIAAAVPFLGGAGAFAVSAVLVLAMRTSGRRAPVSDRPAGWLRRDIAEGLRWLAHDQLLRGLTVLAGLLGLLGSGVNAILVLYALERLGLSERGFGLFVVAAAIGGVAGTVVTPRFTRLVGRGPALRVALAVGGLAFGSMAATDEVAVAAVSFAVSGMTVAVWNIITMSLRQALIPDELLGRVLGAWRTVVWGVMPVGAALGGVLARAAGLGAPFVALGVAHAAVLLFGWRLLGRVDARETRSGGLATPAADPTAG